MTRRLAALGLRAYPLAFRRRYGAEMAALLDDAPPSARAVVDLWRGALLAHLRPVAGLDGFVGRADRLRASVSGVLACWVVCAAAGFGFAISTEDMPFVRAGTRHPLLGDAHGLIQVLAIVASVALVAGALPLIVAALVRAWREPGLRVWVSVPIVAVAAFAALTGVLVLIVHAQHASTASAVAFGLWAFGGLACGAACVIGARRVLFAIAVTERRLLAAFGAGAVVAAAMVAIALASAVYAIALAIDSPRLAAAGNGPLHPTSVLVAVAVAAVVMAGAALTAATTVRRGWRAAR